ncbi:outer membrane immunogenic protein [Bradyrhizobium niftali]|uniref:outer membrane protein n=1 Tax=Bradyrhizobium niftali TaxID=2560055 RepID=UPI0038326CAB
MFRAVSLLLVVSTFTPSWAADLPVKIPPSRMIYSWTGFYAGLSGGYNDIRTIPTTTFTDPNGVIGSVIDAGILLLPKPQNGFGFIGGGQIGYNFQTGIWLVGVESDLSVTAAKSSETMTGIASSFAPIIATTLTQRLNVLGTTRARFGVISNNVMLYGTGGLAYGHVEDSLFIRNTDDLTQNFSSARSGMQVGWTAGAGVEVGMDQWSAKFEYLYYDLGNRTSVALPSDSVGLPGAFATLDQSTRGQLLRVGLNYRFTSGEVR